MTRRAEHAARRGFSLLELAVALAIIGLLAGGTMQLVTAFSAEQRLDVTRQRLKAVERALVRYASRHGRLPCPRDASAMQIAGRDFRPVVAGFGVGETQLAMENEDSEGGGASEQGCENSEGQAAGCDEKEGGDGDENEGSGDGADNGGGSDGGSGSGSGGTTVSIPSGSDPAATDPNWTGSSTDGNCARSNTHVGVPYRQLGIQKSAALDGWNRQITYVVYDGSSGVTKQDGLNLYSRANGSDSTIKLANYVDNLGATLNGLGLRVSTDAGMGGTFSHDPAQGTGAAFVLISHGPNGVGAFTRSGSQIEPGGVAFGVQEKTNRDHAKTLAEMSADAPSNLADVTFIDRARNESQGDAYYDDIVRAVSVHELARRAGWTPLAGR